KGGNGLGLSIARRLIEGYHGRLVVESAVGQGSVFRVSLPLVKNKDNKKHEIKANIMICGLFPDLRGQAVLF
ncbi:ATP-binding protein, partial [Parabacteroides goldsteinii]|uniref:ATP-binding protein n=1 Tax=Parabacteroides goldsteinii TaxID=328812 RepID=UPI00256F258C